MKQIKIEKRKGTYRIYMGDIIIHNEKSFEFVKGWLNNQIRDFREMIINI